MCSAASPLPSLFLNRVWLLQYLKVGLKTNVGPRALSTRLAALSYKTGTYSNTWPPELAVEV